jgi:hypothetical protein
MAHTHPTETVIAELLVTLGAEDLIWATDVGRMRHLESILQQRKVKFPEKRAGELWGNHIESACAELAVARCATRKWMGHINRFNTGPDIEDTNWEVRWSAIQQWKVNAKNDTGKVVVCVDRQAPTYEIVGWVIPELVRRVPEFERNGGDHKYWLVPRNRITRLGVPPTGIVTGEHWKP